MPSARNSRPTLQYALLAIVFAITMVFFAHHLWFITQIFNGRAETSVFPVVTRSDSASIKDVTAEAQTAGIRPGDTLLAINGTPYRSSSQLARATMYARPGDPVTLTVRHNTAPPSEATSRILLAPNHPWVWFQITLGVGLPIFCLLLGFTVVALRPRDPLAWLLLGLLLGFANLIRIGDEYRDATTFGLAGAVFVQIIGNLVPIFLLLLAIYFPRRLPLDRRMPWLKWLLLAPVILDVLFQNLRAEGLAASYSYVLPLPRLAKIASTVGSKAALLCVILFFVIIGSKYFIESSQDARRRLRLLYLGTFFSVVPALILVLFTETRGKQLDSFPWFEVPAFLLLFLFPATIAYLIIVHKALDVRVVIRQGLQYALARGGVRILQAVLTGAVGFVIAYYISHHHLDRLQLFSVIALAIFLGVRLRKLMARLALWIDRRFFREAYNSELLLAELSENVRSIVETRPLLETVASRISEALHVPQIAVLLHSSGPFQPAYALGYGEANLMPAFPQGGATQHLLAGKTAARVYLDDPNNWVNSEPAVSVDERRRLAQLHSELLLPLVIKDRMLGFISLSQKRSEEAYSGTDLHLLNSVASQTALALENSRLSGEIAQEVAHRERLNREMEIAREVQEHLLPQSLPAVAGAEIAGSFRPAQGVGGDYYDFLELPGGKLGIAIGDVSGKGVSAALVMANLQASLRSQSLAIEPVPPATVALAPSPAVVWAPSPTHGDTGAAAAAPAQQPANPLAAILTRINRLIYQSSASSRYATFFFAEYDPASRTLTYVNAGHNPPLLFRAGSSTVAPAPSPTAPGVPAPSRAIPAQQEPTVLCAEVERLATGGPVIGLLPHCDYVQSTLTLHPGDLLLAYTDGITETMDREDEEWGEDALIRTVEQHRGLCAKELLAQIMQAADAFASGAEQFDDMTMLSLRMQ